MLQRRPFTQPARPERVPMAWPGVQAFVPATRCDSAGAAQPKPIEQRNPALLAMARGKACLFQLPGICTGNRATVVACHQNEGKGMGIKQNDHMSAAGCFACHTAYDQGPALRAIKRGWFLVAHARQVLAWQRVVGDMSNTPRERRAAHWALVILESELNPLVSQ